MPMRAPTHKPHRIRLRRPPDERPTAHKRGYGVRWRRLRKLVLQRDHYICQQCGQPAGVSAHADHILAKRAGGADEIGNLQTLCHDCHNRKTKQET